MKALKTDLSIFDRFEFANQPVGVKYLFKKPAEIEQLDKAMSFCEMVKEAQQRGTPFYMSKENENCAGKGVLGMEEIGPMAITGGLGEKLEIFEDGRANGNLIYNVFQSFPPIRKGSINYVVFAPLDKLTFEPDLLILLAAPGQAEIALRAMSYKTGELWKSQTSGVFACASLLVYPYQTGNVNYTITGMSFGMKVKEIFPPGWVLISIPYQKLPAIIQNLKEMKWVLPSYTDGREKFLERDRRIKAELARELKEGL